MRWFNLFRRQRIFRQSEIPQDPEDIKLRFRRTVVIISFFIALIIISIPIFRYRQPAFRSLSHARHLANLIMNTRTVAGENRTETGVRLVGENRWVSFSLPKESNCEPPETISPSQELIQPDSTWRILFLPKYAEDGIGREVTTVCFHPQQGVVADGEPIAEGWLYFLVYPSVDMEEGRNDRSYQIVLSQHGDLLEIQPLM